MKRCWSIFEIYVKQHIKNNNTGKGQKVPEQGFSHHMLAFLNVLTRVAGESVNRVYELRKVESTQEQPEEDDSDDQTLD
jgi:hypothetical protein